MRTQKNLLKGFTDNEVFQTLSLILLFGTFLIVLLSYIEQPQKIKKPPCFNFR